MRTNHITLATIILSFILVLACSRTIQQNNAENASDVSLKAQTDNDVFKYTIATDFFRTDKYGMPYANDLDAEEINITVQIKKINEDDIILYDLDCEGDGDFEYTNQTENQNCIYKRESGNHQIWIRGKIPSLMLCQTDPESLENNPYAKYIPPRWETVSVISVDDWGGMEWKGMKSFAADCHRLEHIPAEAPDLSHVDDVSYMFSGVTNLNDPIEHWKEIQLSSGTLGRFKCQVYEIHVLECSFIQPAVREMECFKRQKYGENVRRRQIL